MLGGSRVIFHIRHHRKLNKNEKDDLQEIINFAKENNVELCLENSDGLFAGDYLIDLLKEFPDLYFCLDIGHLNVALYNGSVKNLENFLKGIKDRVLELHIHYNNGQKDEHKELNKEGEEYFLKILKILDNDKQNMPLTLEGQVLRASDVIAYVSHDIDDAVRAEVIKEGDIPSHLIQIFGKWHASRIDKMVEDVVEASLDSDLEKIAMSREVSEAVVELRDFLYDKVYFNPQAMSELEKTQKILTDLYNHFIKNPGDYIKPYPNGDPVEKRVGDFIAGMTDRYALSLYEKIFFPLSWSGL